MFTSDKYKCSNNTAHVCRACFRRLATTFVHETQPAACLSVYTPRKIAYTHEQSSTRYQPQQSCLGALWQRLPTLHRVNRARDPNRCVPLRLYSTQDHTHARASRAAHTASQPMQISRGTTDARWRLPSRSLTHSESFHVTLRRSVGSERQTCRWARGSMRPLLHRHQYGCSPWGGTAASKGRWRAP